MLDPEGTSVTIQGGAELLDDAWVESIDDEVIDLDDEDAEEDAEAEEIEAEAFADEAYEGEDFADEVFAHEPFANDARRSDPELEALITWFVDELCHAPRQPGGLRRVLAARDARRPEATTGVEHRATLARRAGALPRV